VNDGVSTSGRAFAKSAVGNLTTIYDEPLPQSDRTSLRGLLGASDRFSALIVAHIVLVAVFAELKTEHVLVDGAFLVLLLYGRSARRFAKSIFCVWCVAVIYRDLLPLLLRFRGSIHVGDLYEAERAWFGVATAAGRVIPCDVFRSHHSAILDFVCGAVYVGYQFFFVAFAACLYAYYGAVFRRLMICYLLVHLCGFATYVLYPAAPPWYVEQYGVGPLVADAASNPAGLARFDELLGFPAAARMYAMSSNAFGAMPSLHVALASLYPLLGFRCSRKLGVAGATVAGLTAFGAVYFRHHYILDLVVGIAYAAAAVLVVDFYERVWPKGTANDSAEGAT